MSPIARMPFGRTGHESSRVLVGAAAFWSMPAERVGAVLDMAVGEFGVNHIDTAASYGDSELRLAPWLAEHRSEVFLATKTGDRTGDDARASLEHSLQRLGVDQVDLIQLHNLVEDEEFDVAHGPGGAVEALAKARDEGLVRFIGVTGHGLRIAGMHRRSLERFDFDSVLLPYNWPLLNDPAYRGDVEALLETCAERNVAVQAIKTIARRRWRPEDDGPKFSWYEPLPDGPALRRAVAYALANPQLFLNSSSDARMLRPTLEAAAAVGANPAPPTDDDLASDAAVEGIEPLFDGADLERI